MPMAMLMPTFQFYNSSIKTLSQMEHLIIHLTFQFYNSSIKTIPPPFDATVRTSFQFYNSSIKTLIRGFWQLKLPHFNSIIVRLKRNRVYGR